jgi:broad specificity phosphatase PhoE
MRRLAVLTAVAAVLSSAVASAQKAVLVVRHGEKISEEDERLTEAGRARAARLAAMLGKSEISAIYSTDTERTIGTAQPLADALGQKIRIYSDRDATGKIDFAPFVRQLREENPRGVALVVGHSNTVPELLKALGCEESVSIASDEYDNLFVVVPRKNDSATLVRLRY